MFLIVDAKSTFLDTTPTFVNHQFFKKAVAAIIMNISKEKNMKMFLGLAESVEKVRQEVLFGKLQYLVKRRAHLL